MRAAQMGELIASSELTFVQVVGCLIAIVGLILLIVNIFSKKDDGDFSIDIAGQKINAPRSSIVLLSGVVMVLLPSALPRQKEISNSKTSDDAFTRISKNNKKLESEIDTPRTKQDVAQRRTDGSSDTTAQPTHGELVDDERRSNGSSSRGRLEGPTLPNEGPRTPTLPSPTIIGWTFFGAYDSSAWLQKNFDGGTGRWGAPQRRDIIVATKDVNVRVGPIQRLQDKWTNQPTSGTLKTGDAVTVQSVIQVTPGFYWMEVSR